MGEKSKTVGEIGENIVANFLDLIGWNDPLENQTLSCVKPKKHARKESKNQQRKEHGLDYLLTVKSPSESNTIESIVISVKHTGSPYPNNPVAKFKEHLKDLAFSMECYSRSDIKAKQLQKFEGGVNRQKDTGVIFWLSSSDDPGENVVAKVADIRIDASLKFDSIHLVDNTQVEFIYEVVTFLKSKYQEKEILFHSPGTSLNYTDKAIKRSGNYLPVDFISSPVIQMMLQDKSEGLTTFCTATLERFDEESLCQLLQTSREYTQDVNCKHLFLFPNYVPSRHKDDVINAKNQFKDIIPSASIEVLSYKPDFRSLNNE